MSPIDNVGIAALGHLGLRKEESFGSGGAVDSWQPIISESMKVTKENIYGTRIQATGEKVAGIASRKFANGTISFGITPQNPSQWWQCGLGQSSSPYSIERPLNSLLIQVDKETAALQTSGDMITQMEITSESGGELMCNITIEGKDGANVSAGSPSWVSGDAAYIHSEGTFKLNGVTDNDISAFAVTLNNNNATDLYGSNNTRQEIPATNLEVTGSFTKFFNDNTERDAFLTDLPRSFQVTFNRGGRSYDINIARLLYDDRDDPLSSQSDYVAETFTWTAYVDDVTVDKSVVITTDTD